MVFKEYRFQSRGVQEPGASLPAAWWDRVHRMGRQASVPAQISLPLIKPLVLLWEPMLVNFVNLTIAGVSWKREAEGRKHLMEETIHMMVLWENLWEAWLVWEGLVHCGLCPYPHPRAGGCIEKQSEQVMRNKLLNRHPPWCLLQFLLPGSCFEFPCLGVPQQTMTQDM